MRSAARPFVVWAGVIAHTIGAPAQTPPLLILDSARIAAVRESLKSGAAALKPARASFEEDARRGLAMQPVSVMDKKITPAGGDKHDYMSQAPYCGPIPRIASSP